MTKKSMLSRIWSSIFDNKVTIFFVILCVLTIYASKMPMTFVASELFSRIARNSFIVLALIIPVLTGMGLNFGIVVGAMAAQVGVFLTTHWGVTGIAGFLLTVAVTTPLAVLFGLLVGLLFNRMKGSEMIGGLVLGYFAEGLYQLLFLFIFGGVIKIVNPKLMIATGIGVKNTIDLSDTIKYALDTVSMRSLIHVGFYAALAAVLLSVIINLATKHPVNWKKSLTTVIVAAIAFGLSFIEPIRTFLSQDRLLLRDAIHYISYALIAGFLITIVVRGLIQKKANYRWQRHLTFAVMLAILVALTYIPAIDAIVRFVRLPVTTFALIAGLMLFNAGLMRTRLGQKMRTVGQSRVVANAAGINVNRIRIIAMIFSTLLASWGQLIFLQNVGTFSTYGAHVQIGQFAIAALLVGGASVQKATNQQAILGVVLFHTLFIVAPIAGKELFGNPMIGEYFRVFVSYGVIALALAMHAWKKNVRPNLSLSGPSAAETEETKASTSSTVAR